MRFGQLDYEIAQCEEHLDATGTRNTEAETYLVRYLLVRICAEYETRIRTLVQRRCARVNDQKVLNFANCWAVEVTRRFKISDISGMLKGFGDDYKKAFSDAVNDQPCHVAWDNILVNRHTVAHGSGAVMMTFGDLKSAYQGSTTVVDELIKALCLRTQDIKGLK